jgi:hypothetical protein
MTRSERQDERRKAEEAERKRRNDHTITHIEVCDAFATKPQYLGEYNEDGERPVLNHPHAWFILVTLGDGTRWFSRESTPFVAFIVSHPNEVTPLSHPETRMGKTLREGYREFNHDTGKTSEEWSPLFQVGSHHVTNLEGLIAKARMEERANAVSHAKVLDPDTSEWSRWPYSQYGSEAWEAEMHAVEMSERRDPRNW